MLITFASFLLSHDVAYGSAKTPRNKTNKPLVVYRLKDVTVRKSIQTMRKRWQNLMFLCQKCDFSSIFNVK